MRRRSPGAGRRGRRGDGRRGRVVCPSLDPTERGGRRPGGAGPARWRRGGGWRRGGCGDGRRRERGIDPDPDRIERGGVATSGLGFRSGLTRYRPRRGPVGPSRPIGWEGPRPMGRGVHLFCFVFTFVFLIYFTFSVLNFRPTLFLLSKI